MNSTQTIALLTSLVVGATSAGVAKFGIDPANWQKDVGDLIALGAAGFAALIAHKHHATVVTTPTTTTITK